MSTLQAAVCCSSVALCALIAAGLLLRRLHALCYSFLPYVLAVAAGDALMLGWPERFYRWGFWVAKETACGALKLAVAVELGLLAFQAFPGALRRARQVALVVALATLAALAVPVRSTDMGDMALELQPRVDNGSAMLFMGVWALILWYRIPMHRIHRAILRGFVPYLLVATLGLKLVATLGWNVREQAGLLDSGAYLAMLAYWTWEVWRRVPEPLADPAVVARLQPWRARL